MIRKKKAITGEDQMNVSTERQERPKRFEGLLRYKKIRGGVHKHYNNQTVRKGGILYAAQGELSPLIVAGFKCLDEEIKEATGITLGLVDRGNGWYDVVNKETKEVLNDIAMRAKDARQFITGELEENIIKDNVEEDSKEE